MKLNAYLPPKVLTDFLFNYDIDDVAYVINDDVFTLTKPKIESSSNSEIFYIGNNGIFNVVMKQFDEIEFSSNNNVTFFNSKLGTKLIIYFHDVSSFENKLRETGYID